MREFLFIRGDFGFIEIFECLVESWSCGVDFGGDVVCKYCVLLCFC